MILDNDIFVVNNINNPPLHVVFAPISTPNFNFLSIVIVGNVHPMSLSQNSSLPSILTTWVHQFSLTSAIFFPTKSMVLTKSMATMVPTL
jgi:hypothetical protein